MEEIKQTKFVASVSFGKDSLAMLLKLIEEDAPLDEVVFFDTGMEFGCIYNIMYEVQNLLMEKGIEFTVLRSRDFLELMLDHEVHHRNGTTSKGYKWCGNTCRWYTSRKTNEIKKHLKRKYGSNFKEYVGIASDEPQRAQRATERGQITPLVEWGMTESDCLKFCEKRGFKWVENGQELYKDLDRVSCWCCRNKNLKELKNIYLHHKPYWLALCELERRCGMSMKRKTLLELEEEWKKERNLT